MFQKFRPLGDRILIKRIEAQERTASGIYIPDAAKDKAQTGTVLEIGGGRKDAQGNSMPMEVKTGDTVYFAKYAGTEVDTEHIILQESEILGIVEL